MSSRIEATETDPTDAMATYGIERVPVDYFHWNGFRYSTLNDAIAAARRGQKTGIETGPDA